MWKGGVGGDGLGVCDKRCEISSALPKWVSLHSSACAPHFWFWCILTFPLFRDELSNEYNARSRAPDEGKGDEDGVEDDRLQERVDYQEDTSNDS